MSRKVLNIAAFVVLFATICLTGFFDETAAATKVEGKVNINKATVNELVLLPMIGPSKAAAIIAFREENGPFESIDDLVQVKGIGRRTLQRLEPYLMIEGESNLKVVVVVSTEKQNAPQTDQAEPKPSAEKGTSPQQ